MRGHHWNLNVVTIHSIYITQLNITSYLPDWQSNKTDLTSKIEYIAPGEHKQLPLPASGGKNVKWAAINDYGGSSGTETRPLQ